jgi:hypothetical protein
MTPTRSDLGVWVVGAVALIALAVFAALWFAQRSMVSRIDRVSRESTHRSKQLEARIGALRREVRELGARLACPRDAGSGSGSGAPAAPTGPGKRSYVRITSTPSGAVVRRGKRTIGRTPLVLPLSGGEEATLRLSHGGYHEEEVTVTGADGKALEIRLRKLGGAEGAGP